MNTHFQTIALISRQRRYESAKEVLETLINYLTKHHRALVLEEETAKLLETVEWPTYSIHELGRHSDLMIVIGGDGGLLQVARAAVLHNKPILGINRGHLGFLADIHPQDIQLHLDAILAGDYQEEQRFLLNAEVQKKEPIRASALNDVVLLPGQVAHMIEFEIFIDGQFVSSQRADGLIVATPTGSTAYALSGGGPILRPDVDGIVLVPMFPHTLTSRPLVVPSHCKVLLHIPKDTPLFPRLSCDGQAHIELCGDDTILIEKKPEKLRLIHPANYDYFDTLRVKLGWGRDAH
jgi:NAD+ kinase